MQHCACRDCFEISAAAPKVETEEIYNEESEDYEPVTTVTLPLCWECAKAGCEPAPNPYPEYPTPFESVQYSCQRSDAYGEGGTDAEWERENDLYNRYDRIGRERPQ